MSSSISRVPGPSRPRRSHQTDEPIASSSALPPLDWAHTATAGNPTSTPSGNLLPTSAAARKGKRVSMAESVSSMGDMTSGQLSLEHLAGLRRQSHLSTLSLSPRRPTAVKMGINGKSSRLGQDTRSSMHDESSEMASEPRFRDREMPADQSGVLPTDDDDVETAAADEEEQELEWTMVDRMRNWRNDAMTQHLYGTAGFWGGKVFGMTGEIS